VKKVLIVILIIVAVIVIAALAFLGASGLFAGVKPEAARIDAIAFVYEPFVGPYSKTREPMDRLYYGLLDGEKIETYKGLGIYFDNPANTPAEKCRSIVGEVIEPRDLGKIDALKAKGFKVAELPAGERLTAEFPFANPMSIMLGIMKVYPAIGAALNSSGGTQGAMIELYDVPAKKIRYIVLTSAETASFLELMK
jgi:hypothetical protein